MIKIFTEEEFRLYVDSEVKNYQWITPSALVLKSYYNYDFSDYDKEHRRFERLRAVAEQQRAMCLQKHDI
jgi:hypothetical protein